uniref:Putative monolaris n=1 Tax=Amblyomma parvum TaxID=251391 RepID=A0A023G0X6_AMBPA
MKFLALVFLWLSYGAVLRGGHGSVSTQTSNWPRIYSPNDCNGEVRLVGKHCGHPALQWRYFYNRTTQKCVLFIPEKCDNNFDQGNNFPNREVCMKMCMKKSPCLKPKKGKANGTIEGYTYYASVDHCYSTKYGRRAKFGAAENRFPTEKACYDECAPEIVPKNGKSK